MLSSASWAQDTLVLAGVKNITTLAVDAKGNHYVADNTLTLHKFDNKGNLVTNVNIKSYGDIASIDCSNAFEIYVFHHDQNIIVFYDNMLNQRGEIRLNDFYFNNVPCVARSFDNNIWIVDLSQYKLLKINKKGETLAESPFLNNILGNKFNPTKMWEENNDVYIVDTSNGVHQFDMYATFATTYFHPHLSDALGLDNRIIMKQGDTLLAYNKLLRTPIPLTLRTASSSVLAYHKPYVYHTTKNKLIRQLLR